MHGTPETSVACFCCSPVLCVSIQRSNSLHVANAELFVKRKSGSGIY